MPRDEIVKTINVDAKDFQRIRHASSFDVAIKAFRALLQLKGISYDPSLDIFTVPHDDGSITVSNVRNPRFTIPALLDLRKIPKSSKKKESTDA